MALSNWDCASAAGAFILSLAILAETILVALIRFNLTNVGPYSSLQRAAYATVSTLIASAITAFITSSLRKLWVTAVDQLFTPVTSRDRLQSKWSVVLAVGSLMDTMRHFQVQLTYLAAALITTCIVASLTPTTDKLSIDIETDVAPGLPWRCAMVRNFSDERYSVYEWRLPNGSYLASGGNWGTCPSRWAVTLMGGINFFNASQYAYADLGVAVKSTAIGAPVSIYGGDPATGVSSSFPGFIGKFGSSALETTQCVRVMPSNPVSCHRGGDLKQNQAGTVTATSDDGLCSATSLNTVKDWQTGNVITKAICAKGDPGQATIVLGGLGAYGKWLAVALNDPDRPYEDEDSAGFTITITCNLDARDVFRYRQVTLSLQDSAQIQETNMGRQLNGGSLDCRDFNVADNLGLMATAVSANWQPLSQNDGMDGWIDSINQMTVDKSSRQPRLPPYSLSGSSNALEDTLGLVIALTTARINGTAETIPATATIVNTRVGSGTLLGLVYTIPPMATAAVIFAILARVLLPSQTPSFSSIKLRDIAGLSWLQTDPTGKQTTTPSLA